MRSLLRSPLLGFAGVAAESLGDSARVVASARLQVARRFGVAWILLATVALFGFVAPGGGAAETMLVSTNPESNEVLTASPPAIELVFAGPVEEAEISLLSSDGTVSGPAVGVLGGDGTVVSVEIPEPLADGTWTVLWTATYEKTGVPVAGSFGFRVGVLPEVSLDAGGVVPAWATATTAGSMLAMVGAAIALLLAMAGKRAFLRWALLLAGVSVGLTAAKAVLTGTVAPAAAGLSLGDGLAGLDSGDRWRTVAAVIVFGLAGIAEWVRGLPDVVRKVAVGIAIPVAIAGVVIGPYLSGMVSFGGGDEPSVNPTLVRVDVASQFPLADQSAGVVDLALSPSLPGANSVVVQFRAGGDPLPASAMPMVDIAFTPVAHAGSAVSVNPMAMPVGAIFTGSVKLDSPGWWHALITMVPPEGDPLQVNQWFLLPDPNVTGEGPTAPDDPVARAVWQRALDQWDGLTSIKYSQRLGDGSGVLYQSSTEVSAPTADGPALYHDISTTAESVIIDGTMWTKRDGGDWEESAAASLYLPDEWGEVYTKSRGFQLGPVEVIDGAEYQVIAFYLPKAKRNAAAWYLWWVERSSGQVHREVMVSTRHYMLYRFYDYGVPISVTPPAERTGPPTSP